MVLKSWPSLYSRVMDVDELDAWLRERSEMGFGDERALFCWPDGSPLTVDQLRDLVKALMQSIGLDPARYGAHSLRIGGATAALAAGVSPQLIRLMGRWSSDIYQIYCRMSMQAALGVGVSICSAVVDTVEQGFHEEHFELQSSEVDDIRGAGLWAGGDSGGVPWVE